MSTGTFPLNITFALQIGIEQIVWFENLLWILWPIYKTCKEAESLFNAAFAGCSWILEIIRVYR